MQVNTLPCSINLRHLDQQDINMWQVQEAPVALPDATNNSVATDNGKSSKYNLRTRDPDAPNNRPQSARPHHEATKSVSITLNQQTKAARSHKLLGPSTPWIINRSG